MEAKGMDAMEWLETHRGISCETAARSGVKASKSKGGDPVIGFPYLARDGEVISHKIRIAGDKTAIKESGQTPFWYQPSGQDRVLWNAKSLRENVGPIYITEGEIDALSLLQCGKMRSVSMPDGWTEGLTDHESPKLKPIFDNLDAFKDQEVVVAGDCDKVGRSMARAVFGALEEVAKAVRVVEWPEGCKDANDVLVQHGEAAVVSALDAARIMAPLGIEVSGLHDLPPMPDRTIYRPGDPAYDEVLRAELGTVNVITGIPNHGKSTVAVAALHSMAVHNRVRIGAVMFETHPAQLRNHIHRLETGSPFVMGDPRCDEAARKASKFWAVVHPQEDDNVPFNMDWAKSMIRTLALHHDCKIVLIDPWNELEHNIGNGETETQYIKAALAFLRKVAKRYDVAIFIVAHPKKVELTTPPTGYDIAGSSTWYDKSYMGLTVYRTDDEDGEEHTQFIAWKVKDQEAYGIQRGMVRLAYQHNTGGFKLLTDHNYDRMTEAG